MSQSSVPRALSVAPPAAVSATKAPSSAFVRAWRERLQVARRDVGMVATDLFGRKPPPFSIRNGGLKPDKRDALSLAGRPLTVQNVVRETDDAVSLVLEDPTGLPIVFEPGQFLTLFVNVGGELHRRAYSISSSALANARVTVTCKRVPGGKVSNHLNDHAQAGQTLRVLGPSGSFVPARGDGKPRTLVLLAGGSGITPMMSIARTVLVEDEQARVVLIYGNRSQDDIIFASALAKLAAEVGDRFTVRHVLTKGHAGFAGRVGMLERAVVEGELAATGHGDDARTTYFVCGPEPMMNAAKAALEALGVPSSRVKEERFNQPHLRSGMATSPAQIGGTGSGTALVQIGKKQHTVTVKSDESLLEAALAAGLPMPYSCAMGGCGACKVQLKEGTVAMEEPNCLSDRERAEGYVLTCVGHVSGNARVEVPQ